MIELLTRGALLDDNPPGQAAIHLVTFTGVPGTREFARHVQTGTRFSFSANTLLTGAWVRSWHKLSGDPDLMDSAADTRLLALAASLASGKRVNLMDATAGMGWAHAQRIAQAILIRCGAAQFLTVNGTGKLDDLRVMNQALSAGQFPAKAGEGE
jgi:hypothetical protein